jgi:isoquinoline 1-oxidoreductase subunit beta
MGKWTRRGFIAAGVVTGGALVVGVALRPGHRAPRIAHLVTDQGETLVHVWVKIDSNDLVTVIVPHAEMGQGVHSTLAMMLADELDADWRRVRIMEAPAHEAYANYPLARGFLLGDITLPRLLIGTVDGAMLKATQWLDLQITGGSTSVRATGMYGMRVAGAAAREMLLHAAAASWGRPMSVLRIEQGVIVDGGSDRRAPFSAFVEAAAARTPPDRPQLKQPDAYRLMGRSVPRLDIPAKVDGSARFGIDAVVAGMKHAAIRAAPVFGARLASYDDDIARTMPGVRDVVALDDAVVVVADGYWQAQQALSRMTIEFERTAASTLSQRDLFAHFRADMDVATANGAGSDDRRQGNVDAALRGASRVVEAEYTVPYLAHATMEPMNCTAWIHDGICEIWTGSQNPLGFRADVAAAIGYDKSDVVVHNAYLGGGFGRRAISDYAVQAALVAQRSGMPVKLIWSREEDIRRDHYRPAAVSRFRGGLDATGRPVAWGNLYVHKHDPAEAPLVPYAIGNQRIQHVRSATHVPFGPWRSVDHSQHGFFTESFIDELAVAAGQDPYLYRRGLLDGEPRMRHVLDVAAQQSGWEAAMAAGWGRGISLQRSFGSLVAQVIEVEVRDGKLRVHRVVCAVDCGFAINPDGLAAQMESGIVYGLTAALYGEISIAGGAVMQSNFHDYPLLRFDEMPLVETHIVNSGAALGGAGEPATPGVAPALTNAIFAATGIRIRELPVTHHDLRGFRETD